MAITSEPCAGGAGAPRPRRPPRPGRSRDLLPPVCLHCGGRRWGGTPLCLACLRRAADFRRAAACPRCGDPRLRRRPSTTGRSLRLRPASSSGSPPSFPPWCTASSTGTCGATPDSWRPSASARTSWRYVGASTRWSRCPCTRRDAGSGDTTRPRVIAAGLRRRSGAAVLPGALRRIRPPGPRPGSARRSAHATWTAPLYVPIRGGGGQAAGAGGRRLHHGGHRGGLRPGPAQAGCASVRVLALGQVAEDAARTMDDFVSEIATRRRLPGVKGAAWGAGRRVRDSNSQALAGGGFQDR